MSAVYAPQHLAAAAREALARIRRAREQAPVQIRPLLAGDRENLLDHGLMIGSPRHVARNASEMPVGDMEQLQRTSSSL